MPSLFSRARTTSSPLKTQRQSADIPDDFGRITSRGNGTVPQRKDKNVEKTRTRTLSAAKGRAPGPLRNEEDTVIPDGAFFPLNLDPHGAGDPANHSEPERGNVLSLYRVFSRRRGIGTVPCRPLRSRTFSI